MSETENMPAFPRASGYQYGMTLRDYFAGQALAGCLTEADWGNDSLADIGSDCYRIADAMLAARAKGDNA